MDLNRSWPAVSHISSMTVSSPIWLDGDKDYDGIAQPDTFPLLSCFVFSESVLDLVLSLSPTFCFSYIEDLHFFL